MHVFSGENNLLVTHSWLYFCLTCTVLHLSIFFLIFSPDGTPPSFLMKCALGKCMYSHIKYFVILIYLRFLFRGGILIFACNYINLGLLGSVKPGQVYPHWFYNELISLKSRILISHCLDSGMKFTLIFVHAFRLSSDFRLHSPVCIQIDKILMKALILSSRRKLSWQRF